MRKLLALMLILGLAALCLAPGAQARTDKAIWGTVRMPDGSSAFRYYHDLHVKVFQIQLRWERVAAARPSRPTDPSDPAYRWSRDLDEAVAQGASNHIKIAVMVTGSPPWANGGHSFEWAPDTRDYANFVTAASKRYPSVRRWMIWGEPSLHSRFKLASGGRRATARRYARLLDGAYGALKRRNRRNLVLGGGTVTSGDVPPPLFLKYMRLPSGRPPRLDWFVHNPYTRRFPRLSRHNLTRNARDMSDVDTFAREVHRTYRRFARKYRHRGSRSLRRYFKRFRHRGPPLWLSEFSISSDHKNRAFDFFVSRKTQARYLSAAYRIARRHRYIAGLGWFNLQDDPASANGLTTGLLTYSGVKKPAYDAYKRVR